MALPTKTAKVLGARPKKTTKAQHTHSLAFLTYAW